MEIEIKNIRKKDYKKAIQFAIKGMSCDWYIDNKWALNAYGKYFWYMELNRATQIFAAYIDDEFVGVLLAEVEGEEKKKQNFLQQLYVKLVNLFQKVFLKNGEGVYKETTEEQRAHYLQFHKPDGEIIFLAKDPDCSVKGIGTALLKALEEKEKGKTMYLFTDDGCTYQFYEHRGFDRVEEKDIVMKMPKGDVPLKCLMYSKVL